MLITNAVFTIYFIDATNGGREAMFGRAAAPVFAPAPVEMLIITVVAKSMEKIRTSQMSCFSW